MSKTTVHRPRVRSVELAKFRKVYPQFDYDAKAFGLEVAIHNAGWIKGDDNGRVKAAEAVLPALQLLSAALAGHKHKWTMAQRRAVNKAMRHCEQGLKRKNK